MVARLFRFIFFCFVPLVLILLVLLSFSSYWIYSRFNAEQPVAELTFRYFDKDVYIAELRSGDFCWPEEFPVYGDQWQLDASFLKWKGAGIALGFDSLYRLERLSGRYSNIRDQNTRNKLSHDLRPDVWLDIFESGMLNAGHWLVDTQFGSSVYLDIDTGKKYIVYKTEDALIVKQRPRETEANSQDMLTIEISRACGNEPDFMDKLARVINRLAIRYLQTGS